MSTCEDSRGQMAERLGVIVTETETLTRGRIFGPTLERRLRTSIETLLKVAEWNTRVAAALEQAWLEEAEKHSVGAGEAARPPVNSQSLATHCRSLGGADDGADGHSLVAPARTGRCSPRNHEPARSCTQHGE
jgi:hypothetical protein